MSELARNSSSRTALALAALLLFGSGCATVDPALDYERAQYLRAMSISEFFSTSSGPFGDPDSIRDRKDALQRAFEFEKAVLGYYQALQELLGDNDVLRQLIHAEKGHVKAVMKLLLTDAKPRTLQDAWA